MQIHVLFPIGLPHLMNSGVWYTKTLLQLANSISLSVAALTRSMFPGDNEVGSVPLRVASSNDS